jgi:hypothetical protein
MTTNITAEDIDKHFDVKDGSVNLTIKAIVSDTLYFLY